MFGSELKLKANSETKLEFDIQAVNGLKSVKLIERGKTIQEKSFDNIDTLTKVNFTVKPNKDIWYSLVVEDTKESKAFSNPIWIKLSN